MRHSLRFKITSLLVVCMSLLILLCWILNNTFLERFYQNTKVKMLGNTYVELEKQVAGEDLSGLSTVSDSLLESINELSSKNNLEIYVIGSKVVVASNTSKLAKERMTQSRIAYVYGGGMVYRISDIRLLYTNGEYDVYFQRDLQKQQDYIDLYGILDSGEELFIRANYESIQESAGIASRLLAYVGLVVVLVGSVVIFFISRRFTKPILDLAQISKKMADLDFDAKYEVKGKDEIALLGSSMNELSEKLEQTISELKSANNELQSDIASKIQLDEMRKEFLSNVTHELKTPIALIQGYAEGLQDNLHEDAQSREFYCEVIIDEAQKMNDMVKKLLSLNQIEFGQNQVEMERFDLVSIIRSVIASVDILLKQKKIRLIFEEKEPVYVWADEYLIEEVLTNYVSNAIHYVCGANIIEIKLIRRGNVVRVAVYNTGERIPEDELDKIWIKFYKVDKARTREYGGSGIGLSIVKAIMDSHHRECGVINHESGVEFWFELDCKSD